MAPVAGMRCDTYDPDTANRGMRPRGRRTASDARKTQAPPDRIVFEPERALITGYCRNWWWKFEQEGSVPKRIKLGPKRVGWLLSELQAWLRERAGRGRRRRCASHLIQNKDPAAFRARQGQIRSQTPKKT